MKLSQLSENKPFLKPTPPREREEAIADKEIRRVEYAQNPDQLAEVRASLNTSAGLDAYNARMEFLEQRKERAATTLIIQNNRAAKK